MVHYSLNLELKLSLKKRFISSKCYYSNKKKWKLFWSCIMHPYSLKKQKNCKIMKSLLFVPKKNYHMEKIEIQTFKMHKIEKCSVKIIFPFLQCN